MLSLPVRRLFWMPPNMTRAGTSLGILRMTLGDRLFSPGLTLAGTPITTSSDVVPQLSCVSLR